MGDVVGIGGTAHIPPDKVLTAALGKLTEVTVIGRTADGTYYASSHSHVAEMLWDITQCQHALMDKYGEP